MARSAQDLESDARQLSVRERGRLIHNLIATLDVGEDVDAEEEWLEEAERRYQAYRKGLLTAKPADQALKEARTRLK